MVHLTVLPGFMVNKMESRLLADLNRYFDPTAFLVPDSTREATFEKLQQATSKPVLSPGRYSDDPPLENLVFVFQDQWVVAVIPDPVHLQKLEGETFDRPLYVITPFIEQEYDFSSIRHKVAHIREYARVMDTISAPSITHLTLGESAGDKISTPELASPVYGISPVEGNEQNRGQYIPGIEFREGGIGVERLRSDRLGLQAIYQLGFEYRERLSRYDLTTRENLRELEAERLKAISGIGGYRAAAFKAGAHAIHDETVYRYDDVPYTDANRVFIDIETDGLDADVVWQIGVLTENPTQYRYFLQKDPDNPEAIIREFGDWLCDQSDVTFLAWNGHRFDYKILGRELRQHGSEEHVDAWDAAEKADLLSDVIRECAAPPCRAWNLDTVAGRLGFERETTSVSGKDAADAYTTWKNGGAEPDWDKWITYCKDDVVALKHIYESVRAADVIVSRSELDAISRSDITPPGGVDFTPQTTSDEAEPTDSKAQTAAANHKTLASFTESTESSSNTEEEERANPRLETTSAEPEETTHQTEEGESPTDGDVLDQLDEEDSPLNFDVDSEDTGDNND